MDRNNPQSAIRIPQFAILFLLPFFACTHYYYAPNSLQIPTLREQHDATVTACGVLGDEFRGWELQAAYSPLPYTMLQFTHFNVQGDPSTAFSGMEGQDGQGRLTEGALGFYVPTGPTGVFSCSAGLGSGAVNNYYGDQVQSKLNFRRLYIQPAIGFEGEIFRGGLAGRLVRLSYLNGAIDARIPTEDFDAIQRIEYNAPLLFPEFAAWLGAGFRPIFVQAQFNLCLADSRYKFARSSIGLSITYQIAHLWKQ
ncbi:MAG: hypothetical protein ACR2K1_02585 [Saprospiraceae bacterium]